MSLITTLENRALAMCYKDYPLYLGTEKRLVEASYDWLQLIIRDKVLYASGTLIVNGKAFHIEIKYSPFFPNRFDRIYIKGVSYHERIHVYSDASLCLYHPVIDKPVFKMIPLVKMIPWISEWCIHYLEWKKYGVWLGKEIRH